MLTGAKVANHLRPAAVVETAANDAVECALLTNALRRLTFAERVQHSTEHTAFRYFGLLRLNGADSVCHQHRDDDVRAVANLTSLALVELHSPTVACLD
jgi:hypothetical protein